MFNSNDENSWTLKIRKAWKKKKNSASLTRKIRNLNGWLNPLFFVLCFIIWRLVFRNAVSFFLLFFQRHH